MNDDQIFQKLVSESQRCQSEADKISPKVAAAIRLANGDVHFAYRGEVQPGEHAEFTLLEKKLRDTVVEGATLFATLEPCTKRGAGKVPCAERIRERKIKSVWIGMVDPNPDIKGNGIELLRQANIEVQLFPLPYCNQIEEINRDFIRSQRRPPHDAASLAAFSTDLSGRPLDDWYKVLNKTYWNRNFQRSSAEILLHLVEVIGALSHLASEKTKPGITPESYIPKAIAWWLALCGKLGVKSVEKMLWAKFPYVCTYCHKKPHDNDTCVHLKQQSKATPWETLQTLGDKATMPRSIGEWQRMFNEIYPTGQGEGYQITFGRLSEELGELAEAVRVFPAEPGYFLSEASDVFAWLMHLANVHESKKGIPISERFKQISSEMGKAYPDSCRDCGERSCKCPPILESTIGRIAHEVPKSIGTYDSGGSFATPDTMKRMFLGE